MSRKNGLKIGRKNFVWPGLLLDSAYLKKTLQSFELPALIKKVCLNVVRNVFDIVLFMITRPKTCMRPCGSMDRAPDF